MGTPSSSVRDTPLRPAKGLSGSIHRHRGVPVTTEYSTSSDWMVPLTGNDKVELAAPQLLPRGGDLVVVVGDMDVGIGLREAEDQLLPYVVGGAAHRQHPALVGPHVGQLLLPLLQLPQGGVHMDQEALPVGVEPEAVLPPVEELHPQLPLQLGQHGGQGGLRDEQLLGRLGQVPLLGHGLKILQLQQ